MNDRVILRGRTTLPFGPRRVCDVCGLIEVEHPDRLGNLCYRRIIAGYFNPAARSLFDCLRGKVAPLRLAGEDG